MVKQTAIQELIQEFNELKKTKLYEKSFKAIDDCIFLALAKLPKEEEQIIDAFNNNFEFKNSIEYYNKTFKNND